MKKLFLKLLRDIRYAKGQYIAITLVILLGVAFYCGVTSASSGAKQNINEFYENQKLADFWITVPQADALLVSQIRELPGIAGADGRMLMSGISGDHEFVVHTISANPTVNIPFMESGRLPETSDECIIDRGYAKVNKLQVGDTINLTIKGESYRMTISGIFNSPEYLYLSKNITETPNHEKYGAIFISEKLLPEAPFNEIVVKTIDNTDNTGIAALKQSIAKIALPTGAGVILEREQLLSWRMLDDDIGQFSKVGTVFPNIFFLVAAAIIFISMSKNVETQRGQIGNLKALGIRRGWITFHFLSYTLFTCFIGSVLGTVVGVLVLMPAIQGIFTMFYTMPVMHPTGFWINIAIAVALAFCFGILATIISVRKPLKESPASAMRPKAPRKIKPVLLERNEGLWSRISFGHKIVLRNLFLNKGRALLSSIGIIGCVGLMLAAFSFMDCINNILNNKFYEMNQYDVNVVFKSPLPTDEAFPFMSDGIRSAWPQGSIPASFESESGTVSTDLIALDSGCNAIALYDLQGKRLSFPTDGVLIPKLYADKHGLSVGDSITLTLSPVGTTTHAITVKIAGIALEYLGQDIYTSYDYISKLGEIMPVSSYYLQLNKNADAVNIAAEMKENASIKLAMAKKDMAKTWAQSLKIMNAMVFILIAASAVLALTVVYNISAINIFERRRDIATLKVLGYHRKEVNRLVFQENLLITGFGSLLGIGAGAGMLWLIIKMVVSDEMMIPLVISPLSVVYAITLGFAFTFLANQLLRGKIKKIDMVESLKSVE